MEREKKGQRTFSIEKSEKVRCPFFFTHVGRVLSRLGPYRELGLSLEGLDHKQLQRELVDPKSSRRSGKIDGFLSSGQ